MFDADLSDARLLRLFERFRQGGRQHLQHQEDPNEVENMFINEYMPMAPGEYVKVYLFALMYADIGEEMSNRMIAKQLDIQEEDVLKAWNYWEHLGLISKIPFEHGGRFDYTIEFMNLKEHLYTASAKGADSTSTLYSPISSSDVSSVKRVPLEESVAADLSDLLRDRKSVV